MISVSEATRIILQHRLQSATEEIPLTEATGRVLGEFITADRDFPPFNRVTMDGIALAFAAWEKGQRRFPVEGIQAAGMPQLQLQNPGNCLEVMTGAVLPAGTDTVIPYEQIHLQHSVAQLDAIEITSGQNIHRQGSDKTAGALLISPGVRLSPAEIAVAATVGKANIQVRTLPRMAIISTGDELVDAHETPLTHQIRRSNSYALASALREMGVLSSLHHIIDEKDRLRESLATLLDQNDALILSGGVSQGKFDFVPEILGELGVAPLFHRVQQRPGKPLWFGKSDTGKVVFALPGNPVSTFMCFFRYVRPWLQQSQGMEPGLVPLAQLGAEVTFKPNLTYFLQVRVRMENGTLLARPVAGKGSGDLANLLEADGFLELPPDREIFRAGETFPVYLYK